MNSDRYKDKTIPEQVVNRVEISGSVASISGHEITIYTMAEAKKSSVKLTFHGHLPDGIGISCRVRATGHMRTYNKVKEDGKVSVRQECVLDSIQTERTLNELENNWPGTFYPKMFTRAYLYGTVSAVKSDGEWQRIRLHIDDVAENIVLSLYRGNNTEMPEVNKGDAIYTTNIIMGKIKSVNDRRKYFEDLIIQDIFIGEKAKEAM